MEKFQNQLYIHREKEYNEITYGLKKFDLVALYGDGGIGKTTLAKYYSENSPIKFDEVFFYNGYQLQLDKTRLDLFLAGGRRNQNTLIIIDGIDEIRSQSVKEGLNKLIKEGKKYGYKLLITCRSYFANSVLENNFYKVNINGLEENQVSDLINKFGKNNNDTSTLKNLVTQFNGNPLVINLALKALKQGKYSIEELKKLLETQLSYKNELIGQIASKPEILTLDTPEIIRDVKVINKSILQKIDRNPNEIYHLNSRQFEELVAELFEERGYNVKLTQQTRDGGKDLIIINKGMLGDFLIYGECKKWAPNRPVGVNVVSDLAGRMLANSATAGLVVTSSYFSPDAQIFTQKIKHRMSLVDFVELSKWITPQKNK